MGSPLCPLGALLASSLCWCLLGSSWAGCVCGLFQSVGESFVVLRFFHWRRRRQSQCVWRPHARARACGRACILFAGGGRARARVCVDLFVDNDDDGLMMATAMLAPDDGDGLIVVTATHAPQLMLMMIGTAMLCAVFFHHCPHHSVCAVCRVNSLSAASATWHARARHAAGRLPWEWRHMLCFCEENLESLQRVRHVSAAGHGLAATENQPPMVASPELPASHQRGHLWGSDVVSQVSRVRPHGPMCLCSYPLKGQQSWQGLHRCMLGGGG